MATYIKNSQRYPWRRKLSFQLLKWGILAALLTLFVGLKSAVHYYASPAPEIPVLGSLDVDAVSVSGASRQLSAWRPWDAAEPTGWEDSSNASCTSRPPRHLSLSDKCGWVRENCGPFGGAYLNYLEGYYCHFSPHGKAMIALFYIVMVLWGLALFYMLGDTADTYFCPSLAEISEGLRLSPNVAGVTFLALGNGAPDIASIIVGVTGGSNDIGFGEPLGAGMFVTTVVMAAITFAVDVRVTRRPFMRDVGFYFVATLLTILFYRDKVFHVGESLTLLLLYVVYVLVVVIGRIIYQRWKLRRHSVLKISINNSDAEDSSEEERWKGRKGEREREREEGAETEPLLGGEREKDSTEHFGEEASSIGTSDDEHAIVDAVRKPVARESTYGSVSVTFELTEAEIAAHSSASPTANVFHSPATLRRMSSVQRLKRIIRKPSTYFAVVRVPLDCVRDLTIPKVEEGCYNRWMHAATVGLAPLFLLCVVSDKSLNMSVSSSATFPLFVVLMLAGLLLGWVVWMYMDRESPKRLSPLFVVLAFIQSVAWIYIIANELVGLLETIGLLLGINNAILAMTVLAWGNSVGDMVADLVVARKGHIGMAIGAVYGGPMMNLLLGLGTALTIRSFKAPLVVEDTHETYQLVMMNGVFLLASLGMALLSVPLSKWHSRRWLGVSLVVLYVFYLLMSILVELGKLKW